MKIKLNYLKAVLALMVLLLVPALSQAQQNLLVQTTLTVAQVAPALPGNPPGNFQLAQLASVTGIQALALNPTTTINVQNQWVIYVDREMELVTQVNGTVLTVNRGYNSTVATSHQAGAMVLYGRAGWFYQYDPGAIASQGGIGINGAPVCTVAGQYVFPWVNVRTGAEWACDPFTLTYVPWFNNSLNPAQSVDFGTSAATTGAQPIIAPLFRLSGTNAITSFTISVGMNATLVGGAQFCIIPTGAFTATATNNIAAATTAVVGKTLCYTWDAGTAKFNPSY